MITKRLYISADIEGVAGVVSKAQTGPVGFEYQEARQWMTNEVIAVCEAATEVGVEEIVVSDSHGNAQNLLPDRLPSGVKLVRGWPRPLGMMQGIEMGRYEAAIFVGYHVGAGAMTGVLPHTNTGAFRAVKVNGRPASETLLNAGVAAHFGVPVILATGDDAYTRHVADLIDGIETATVKWSYGATSARTMLPQDACQIIREKTQSALSRRSNVQAQKMSSPVEVEVDLANHKAAELIAYLPMFERLSATTLKFEVPDMCDVVRSLRFLAKAATLE